MEDCRLLVCGGRHFSNVPLLWRSLDRFDAKHPVAVVIEGASDDVTGPYVGADFWAWQWCVAHDRESVRVHADWSLGRRAGPLRNKAMRDEHKPDYVVAFRGGSGTQEMIALAKEVGIPVWGITQD